MSADGLYEILDDRFRTGRCANGDSRLEVLYDGCRWDEATGTVGVFRTPAGYSNGNTLDRQGRLVTCEQGNRRVTRTESDGTVTVLADRYDGKRLNSPNDVVVRADGSIWFTDPSYGIDGDYEGNAGTNELGAC